LMKQRLQAADMLRASAYRRLPRKEVLYHQSFSSRKKRASLLSSKPHQK